MTIEYGELPEDGRAVFAPMLHAMREQADTGEAGWVNLKGYENQASAYDAAWRLGKLWPDFEFAARGKDGVTHIYARYTGEGE